MDDTLPVGGHVEEFAATTRTDRWWLGPLLTVLGLTGFIIYSTWAAFQGAHYYADPYLSPFFSPVIFTDLAREGAAPLHHAWLGTFPTWWPAPFASPAFLILAFPGLFRFTCYYYRKAYYRSFGAQPVGCGVVGIKRKNYQGETKLLIFQNLHRYAMYIALVFIVFLTYDAFISFFHEGKLGIGVGSVVLTINATLLACYTFGCHSFRHLIGGNVNCFSCTVGSSTKHTIWKKVTKLNENHMLFAWTSLFWVGFTDFYVRMVSMGVINDFNTWGI